MAAKSISGTKQVRYLLGLSSRAERERIESEYFEDEAAFQEMLAAEDDLVDAYARGELAGEERRRFEKSFVSSSHGRDRVQFARAFANSVSSTRPVETKFPGAVFDIFKSFRLPRLLRTATIAVVIVFIAMFAWLVIASRRMANELPELRAESAELSKRTEALQRSADTGPTRTAEIAAQTPTPKAQLNEPRRREERTAVTQQARHLAEVKNEHDQTASSDPKQAKIPISTQNFTVSDTFVAQKITQLPLNAGNIPNLLTLQPGTTRDGYVAGGRADQSNITLDGVSITESLNTYSSIPLNVSSSGGTTFRGTIKDPKGNVVSDAAVTLTSPAANFTRTQYSNGDGTYVFNAIPPGTYCIEVAALGFKSASVSGLAAVIDTPTIRDVQLEIGSVSETVDVTAGAEAAINTSRAVLGNSFERRSIVQLPLNANNVAGMLSLQPGVTRPGFVNGGCVDQSSITLDGVDATVRISGSLSWIRFQLALETAVIYEDYRLTIKTADGRAVTSVDWIEPLTPNQTIIDTPAISTVDLPSGDYVLLLMGKEPDGSYVKVAEYFFKVI